MSHDTTFQLTTPSARELVMTRAFDAPRHLVFDAMTKPELLQRWYAPAGWTLVVCEVDLVVGGHWRFVMTRPNGHDVGQYGVYREIMSPARIVNTESWEDWNPGELLVTLELVENEGTTTLTQTVLFPTTEVRDMLLESGFHTGAAESFESLARLLATME